MWILTPAYEKLLRKKVRLWFGFYIWQYRTHRRKLFKAAVNFAHLQSKKWEDCSALPPEAKCLQEQQVNVR